MIIATYPFPGRVVLTVETMFPGGQVISFNVTVRATGSTEDEAMTVLFLDQSPSQTVNLTVSVPSGGSFSFDVINFNSFGSLGITDNATVMDVPPGNFFY